MCTKCKHVKHITFTFIAITYTFKKTYEIVSNLIFFLNIGNIVDCCTYIIKIIIRNWSYFKPKSANINERNIVKNLSRTVRNQVNQRSTYYLSDFPLEIYIKFIKISIDYKEVRKDKLDRLSFCIIRGIIVTSISMS